VATKCPQCQSENTDTARFCSNCAASLIPSEEISAPTETLEAAREELTTGSTFANRYQIIEELGKGGMGKVYKALDKEIDGKVALKLIKPEVAADKNTIKRFRNELKMARDIAHKNVCRMYDLNKEEGTYYITMEYVSGEDLKSFIRRAGPLSAGKTIFIAKQVCDGLAEAHHLSVVHRDLKPQNIMIDKEGNARIMDFGIARSVTGKGITGAGVMIGTPEYMSPEQVEGKEVDQRSDIYSLGVILYEMVTGRVPFEGETPLSIAVKHKTEAPKEPRELNSQIPDDLNRVILKCMEKGKEKRYQSAGEVRSELEKIEKGIPTTERVVLKRKPITSREITVTFGLKKLLIPALIAVAVVIIGVILWQVLPKKETLPFPSGKPSLAVVYFENNTGEDELDHWRKALCELLIADLTQSKYIQVVSSDKLIDILGDLNQLETRSFSARVLKEVAARGGATYILRGSYTKAGDNFRINAILQEARTMESIGSERIEGRGEESFHSMVDELTRKVKEKFKLSVEQIASDIDEDVGKITTFSPEALKYYVEGRRYHAAREYVQSIEQMEKAVAIDPDFAMAYRSLAVSYGNRGLRPQNKKYKQKALSLLHRLSTRERYQIEADFYGFSEKTYDKAIEAYKKLLELYPDDPIANHNLAGLYSLAGEREKAIHHYEVTRKNNTAGVLGYGTLASQYQQKGLYDQAAEALEECINKFPDKARPHLDLAHHYQILGKFDLARAEIDKAFALEPSHFLNLNYRGDNYFYTGDFALAEQDYRKLLEEQEPGARYMGYLGLIDLDLIKGKIEDIKPRCQGVIDLSKPFGINWTISEMHLLLAYSNLISGHPESTLIHCEQAWNYAEKAETYSRQRRALHLRGLAFIQMNEIDKALKTADDLKKIIQESLNPQLIRYYLHLVGNIELKHGNFSQAIDAFKQALQKTPLQSSFRTMVMDSLAFSYFQSGELDSAQEEYERISQLTTGRFQHGDIYAKSFYMLGKIYEQKGWKGKAIEHYQKFLNLWKDADPGIAEVEDAKKGLAGLKK
jgi:serine/threonine protein kinase/Flp pilus assembly protein TadD